MTHAAFYGLMTPKIDLFFLLKLLVEPNMPMLPLDVRGGGLFFLSSSAYMLSSFQSVLQRSDYRYITPFLHHFSEQHFFLYWHV